MPKKIMFVDDDLDILFSFETVLHAFTDDFEFTSAKSGEECIKILESNGIPDLILLDIMMPNMDGLEVFKKIKDNPKWEVIPIAFLSSVVDDDIKNKCNHFGIKYIEKPIGNNNLIAKIKELTE